MTPDQIRTAVHLDTAGFVVTDADAIGRLDRSTWSPTGQNAWTSCPARWAIEKLLPEYPDPWTSANLGTAGHKVFERLYAMAPHERTPENAAEILAGFTPGGGDVLIPDGVEDLMRWQVTVLDKIAGLWQIEDPAAVHVLALEREIRSTVGSVPFFGKVDRTDQLFDANGEPAGFAIVDYKTGKPTMPSKRDTGSDAKAAAMIAYHLAITPVDGAEPSRLVLLHTDRKTKAAYCPTATERAKSRVAAAWETSWAAMQQSAQTGLYPYQVSTLCGWCPLATVCPAADAAGRGVAKVPGGTTGETLGLRTVSPAHPVAAPTPDPATGPQQPVPVTGAVVDDRNERIDMNQHYSGVVSAPAYTEETGGRLNPASYAAGRINDLARHAVTTLQAQGRPVNRVTLPALVHIFAAVVLDAVTAAFGRPSWQDGGMFIAERALGNALRVFPAPLGGDADTWAQWRRRVDAFIAAEIDVVGEIWTTGPDPTAWQAFSPAQPAQPAQPAA